MNGEIEMANKRFKVIFEEFSEITDKGIRELIQRNEICTCNERGTAELIKQFMTEKYKSAGFNMDLKNEQIHFVKLSVV